jgi:CrcB protein
MDDALIVAIGAVPGAWLRFRLVNHLEPMVPRKHWGTFAVNVAACFSLGLIVSLVNRPCPVAESGRTDPILLLLGTGFLGSLSTFSTFTAELAATLREGHWRELLLLGGGSLLVGFLAMQAGLRFGA